MSTAIEPFTERFKNIPDQGFLKGKSILVTGGTGSFGKKFIEQVLNVYEPSRLIVFSRDELKQWEMQQDSRFIDQDCMRYFIGDVRDGERMKLATRGVDYIIHAAALKHVTVAEYNPFECILTNTHGAQNIVNAAIENNVQRVLALSTDKACNPINLYGASKLAADKIFTAANNISGIKGTKFAVARYGNVVGSRGSIVPLFQKMIENGAKEIPITDERMTRFWITLTQGVNFVLSSMEMMHGGEIFVPKIPSMNIVDSANALSGGLPIKIIGIRPGEKLHEILISNDECRTTLDAGDRYVVEPQFVSWKREPFDATPVSGEFNYSSDNNSEWLSAEQFCKICDDA